MNWYIEPTLADGTIERPLYCTSRDEARERRRFYLTMCELGNPRSVVKATVRAACEVAS